MKAIVLKEIDSFPALDPQWKEPEKKKGEVLVNIRYAALNRRDYWISRGLYPGVQLPVILGSDGAGIYDGKEVLLYPATDWGDVQEVQSDDYKILGTPEDGTMAEYISTDPRYIFNKPKHLTLSEAAALPLAGLTAYRALFTKGQIQKGQRILITGIGGGVAAMAMKFALALKAEVWVTSGSDEKIDKARMLGCKGGINYHETDWFKKAGKKGFDLIIDSAAGKGFSSLIKMCNPAARIVVFGGTNGQIEQINPQLLFWRQISLLGSTMGSPEEFERMLSFVSSHKIHPEIDSIFMMEEANVAFHRMAESHQFGKIVIAINE
jgi:NADPH:quinone reductase-like Zn-dependent oxidoreductase